MGRKSGQIVNSSLLKARSYPSKLKDRPHPTGKKPLDQATESHQSLLSLPKIRPPWKAPPSFPSQPPPISSLLLLLRAEAATLLVFPSQCISCARFAVQCDFVVFLGSQLPRNLSPLSCNTQIPEAIVASLFTTHIFIYKGKTI